MKASLVGDVFNISLVTEDMTLAQYANLSIDGLLNQLIWDVHEWRIEASKLYMMYIITLILQTISADLAFY